MVRIMEFFDSLYFLQVRVHWRGFQNVQDTLEPIRSVYKEVPQVMLRPIASKIVPSDLVSKARPLLSIWICKCNQDFLSTNGTLHVAKLYILCHYVILVSVVFISVMFIHVMIEIESLIFTDSTPENNFKQCASIINF